MNLNGLVRYLVASAMAAMLASCTTFFEGLHIGGPTSISAEKMVMARQGIAFLALGSMARERELVIESTRIVTLSEIFEQNGVCEPGNILVVEDWRVGNIGSNGMFEVDVIYDGRGKNIRMTFARKGKEYAGLKSGVCDSVSIQPSIPITLPKLESMPIDRRSGDGKNWGKTDGVRLD